MYKVRSKVVKHRKNYSRQQLASQRREEENCPSSFPTCPIKEYITTAVTCLILVTVKVSGSRNVATIFTLSHTTWILTRLELL